MVDSYGFAFISVNLFLIIGDDLLRFPSCLLYTKLVWAQCIIIPRHHFCSLAPQACHLPPPYSISMPISSFSKWNHGQARVLAGAAASWKTKFFKWTNVQSFIFEKNLLLIDYIPLVVSRPFIDQSLERFFWLLSFTASCTLIFCSTHTAIPVRNGTLTK